MGYIGTHVEWFCCLALTRTSRSFILFSSITLYDYDYEQRARMHELKLALQTIRNEHDKWRLAKN